VVLINKGAWYIGMVLINDNKNQIFQSNMRRELMGTRQWHKPVDFDFNGNSNIFSGIFNPFFASICVFYIVLLNNLCKMSR
jgi:hypothetical protein